MVADRDVVGPLRNPTDGEFSMNHSRVAMLYMKHFSVRIPAQAHIVNKENEPII
jgi:hypothetical protein